MEFPVFSTKIAGDQKTFDLTDPSETQAYFRHKAGGEIKKLKTFLATNTFVPSKNLQKILGISTLARVLFTH